MLFASDTVVTDRNKVIRLLKNYGEDTLSYFHVQEERQYFFSPSGKSFVSFKIFNKVAVVATDPVGPVEELPQLLDSFLQYTTIWKLIPFFVGLSNTFTPLLRENGLRITKIGEEAILELPTFDRHVLKKKVKRAVRHLEERGIEIFFFNPTTLPLSVRNQIEDISNLWLKNKGGKEKGFSMTLKRIPNAFDKDCQIVVAMKEEIVLGYLCFVPAYQTQILSLDQARRRPDAPNGLNEFLIIKSAEYFKTQHIKKLSLNFATFSNITTSASSLYPIKMVLSNILGRVYQCHSLRTFNEKFLPRWESRYAAYATLKHMPLCTLALLRAER